MRGIFRVNRVKKCAPDAMGSRRAAGTAAWNGQQQSGSPQRGKEAQVAVVPRQKARRGGSR